jgi:bacillithiol biosynthesis cysteine-adding enzyme BshC
VAPGLSRLFLDYCAGDPAALRFYGVPATPAAWQNRPPVHAHSAEIIDLLAAQNPHAPASIQALRQGAGTVVTGQQVALFGGPLFTPFKAATALARAASSPSPHVAIFWLASEDHDFAEINHVTFPARREMRKLVYEQAPPAAVPVGSIALDATIEPLLDAAGQLLGHSDALEALNASYRPGRTFAQAFADFYSRVFAAQGLLILDASSRDFHRLGAPVLRAAIERADEFHSALLDRDAALQADGYHVQVTVAGESSLIFLLDAKTGARIALKRLPPGASEPAGIWLASHDRYSTADLLAILDAEPERISPSALLRPVFQDYLLGTSLQIAGPAEIAYFAQSAVLFERILGRTTPFQPRLSATLIEPQIAELLRRHELSLERVFAESEDSLAQLLAARAMPVEGKRRLAAAGNALDSELTALVEWMQSLDNGLGQSAETAAGKIRYQMSRLRRMAADFELQREASLARHAQAIAQSLYPNGLLQERLHGAAYYFARYGLQLAQDLVHQAKDPCPGHAAIWL